MIKPHHHTKAPTPGVSGSTYSTPQRPLTTPAELGVRFPFGLTDRCRKALGVTTKYPADFIKATNLDKDDNYMAVRIVSVAWLKEMAASGVGYCRRRLQIQCYKCKLWICPGHYYCQHIDSGMCKRNQEA